MSIPLFQSPITFPGSESCTRYPLYFDSFNRDRSRQPNASTCIVDIAAGVAGWQLPVQALSLLSAEIPQTQWTIEKAWSRLYFDMGIRLSPCETTSSKEIISCCSCLNPEHRCDGVGCSRILVALSCREWKPNEGCTPVSQQHDRVFSINVPTGSNPIVGITIENATARLRFTNQHGVWARNLFRTLPMTIEGLPFSVQNYEWRTVTPYDLEIVGLSAEEITTLSGFAAEKRSSFGWLFTSNYIDPHHLSAVLTAGLHIALEDTLCAGCKQQLGFRYNPDLGRFEFLADLTPPTRCECSKRVRWKKAGILLCPTREGATPSLAQFLGFDAPCRSKCVDHCRPSVLWARPATALPQGERPRQSGGKCCADSTLSACFDSNIEAFLLTGRDPNDKRSCRVVEQTATGVMMLRGSVFLPEFEISLCAGDVLTAEDLVRRINYALGENAYHQERVQTITFQNRSGMVSFSREEIESISEEPIVKDGICIQWNRETSRIEINSDEPFDIISPNDAMCATIGLDPKHEPRDVRRWISNYDLAKSRPRSVISAATDRQVAMRRWSRSVDCLPCPLRATLSDCRTDHVNGRIQFEISRWPGVPGTLSPGAGIGEYIFESAKRLKCLCVGQRVFIEKQPARVIATDLPNRIVLDFGAWNPLSGDAVLFRSERCPLNLYLGATCGQALEPPHWPPSGAQGSWILQSLSRSHCNCPARECRARGINSLLIGAPRQRDILWSENFMVKKPTDALVTMYRDVASVELLETPDLRVPEYVLVCLLEPQGGSRENQHAAGTSSIVSNVLAKVQLYPRRQVALVIPNLIKFASAPSRWRSLGLSLLNPDHTAYNLHGRNWSATLVAYVQ